MHCTSPSRCQLQVQPLLLPLQLTAAQMMQRAAGNLLQLQLVPGMCSAVQARVAPRLLHWPLQQLELPAV